jgi:hypothetical protein
MKNTMKNFASPNGNIPENHSNPQDSNPQDSNKKVRILEYQNEKRTMKNFASPKWYRASKPF